MLESTGTPATMEETQDVEIGRDVTLHVETLRHRGRAGRMALYLRGLGTARNHLSIT